MSRAAYCRRQAQLCRDLAAQLSNQTDVERLGRISAHYDAEADGLDAQQQQPDTDMHQQGLQQHRQRSADDE